MTQSEALIQKTLETTPDMAKILVHVPGVALVVLGLGLAFWAVYWDYRRQALEFEERRLMIERGVTPPPYVRKRTKFFDHRLNLGMGMFLTFLGFGLGLATLVQPSLQLYPAAVLTGVLGVGQVVYYYLGTRDIDRR